KTLPGCGRIAVTPVRTLSPSITVVCPTSTPATSVIELREPGGNTPGAMPISRARGRGDRVCDAAASLMSVSSRTASSQRRCEGTCIRVSTLSCAFAQEYPPPPRGVTGGRRGAIDSSTMTRGIIPLYGHDELRDRLRDAAARGALPSTLLFQGNRGVGKQRLALWLAQLLLCERELARAPCDECRGCRFALELTHPDLHWYFPRPRPKDSDPDLDEVRADYAEAIAERVGEAGLYPPPSGSEGIYIATVRAIVQQAVLSPAISKRKVFIVGDAERMVPQEGSEQAANAFLKLLEEPPADTTVILTSSEPGALLPTVRSRVSTMRVPSLPHSDVNAFLADERVMRRLDDEDGLPRDPA